MRYAPVAYDQSISQAYATPARATGQTWPYVLSSKAVSRQTSKASTYPGFLLTRAQHVVYQAIQHSLHLVQERRAVSLRARGIDSYIVLDHNVSGMTRQSIERIQTENLLLACGQALVGAVQQGHEFNIILNALHAQLRELLNLRR